MLSTQAFSDAIIVLNTLIKSDAPLATEKLQLLKKDLRHYSPNQQIAFYNLQSEFLLDYGQVQVAQNNAIWGLDIAKGNNIINEHVVELTYTLGFSYESQGHFKTAEQHYNNGLEIAQSLDDLHLITKGLVNLGAIYYLTEQFENSLLVLSDALEIATKANDDELLGLVTSEFGILYGYLEQVDKAMEFYQQCYQYFKKVNDQGQSLNCLINMGLNELNSQKYEHAVTLFKRAEKESAAVKNTDLAHNIYLNLSIALLKQKKSDPEASYQYLLIAEQYLEDIEHHEAKISFYMSKAYVLEGLGKYDEALTVLEKTEALLPPKGDSYKVSVSKMNVLFIRAKALKGKEQYQRALSAQADYAVLLREIEHNEKLNSIQELRVKYESEQADIEQEILQEQQLIQDRSLQEKNKQKEVQFYSVVAIGIIILLFAWWLSRLISAHKRLYNLMRIDELTGIPNRHRLGEVGDKFFEQSVSSKNPLSLLMIDVDHFKSINDTLGHNSGDTILKAIAVSIALAIRDQDVLGRLGGEEFVCLLPDTPTEKAIEIAEKINQAISNMSTNIETPYPVTLSIGVATIDYKQHTSIGKLLRDADLMMYQAKANGRNQVCA